MVAKSDFGRAVADAHRGLRRHVEAIPTADRSDGKTPSSTDLDRSVKEQVLGDIDRMIEHHESRKPFPGCVCP